jgi:DNA-binding NarL/FixJ family response regulator
MNPLRVVLADDHALVRAGLRSLLDEFQDMSVVGEAEDGAHALELIAKLHPDIALLDIAMPNLNGLEACARASKEYPGTRVIILSMHGDDEYVRRALLVGAKGYLLKNAGEGELELAVRAVARGDTWLSPAVSSKVVAAYTRGEKEAPTGLDLLTPRQREVLQLIAEGKNTKEIAKRLDIGVKTVETHRMQLMDRLGVRTVPELVRCAIRLGVVSA